MKKLLALLLVPLVTFAGVRRQVTLELVSDLTTYSPYDGERVTTLGISTVGDVFMEWVWDSASTNTPSAFVKTNAVKSGRFLAITLAVPSSTYGTNWSGSTEVPTKGDIYTKIEALSLAAGITNASDLYVAFVPTNYSVASPNAENHFINLDAALGGISGGGGDVYTSSNNVFTGDNTMTNLTVTGTMTVAVVNTPTLNATNIVGDGSSITNLQASNVVMAFTPTNVTPASTSQEDFNIAVDDVLGSMVVGDVSGPASSTDTAVARFSGTGGKTLQDSGVTIDGSDNVTVPGDLSVGGTLSMDTAAIGTMVLTNALGVASGGTGSGTAAGARTNLGLTIGVDVQGYDTDLAAVSAGTAMPTALTNSVSVGSPTLIAGTTNVASALAAKAPSASPTLTAPTLNDGITFEQTTPSAYSAVTNWVVDPTASQYQYIATATNVNFLHATNAAAGRQTVFLIGRNTAGTSTVTIPSALFAYNTNTVDVAENEFVAVSFYYYGSDNTNVIATVGNVYSR